MTPSPCPRDRLAHRALQGARLLLGLAAVLSGLAVAHTSLLGWPSTRWNPQPVWQIHLRYEPPVEAHPADAVPVVDAEEHTP